MVRGISRPSTARCTLPMYTRRTQVFGFSIADDLEIFGQ